MIREIHAPDGYLIDNVCKQSFEVNAGKQTILNYTDTKKSAIQIIKVDAKTGEPLEGAKFEIKDSSGDIIGTYTTDDTGVIIIDNLNPGTYIIHETQAPDGYSITNEEKIVNLVKDKAVIITIENNPDSVINLKKTDSITSKPLAGAEFTLSDSTGKILGRYTTDATGCLTTHPLKPGIYTLTEVHAPDGYILNSESKTVTVISGEQSYVSFTNSKKSVIEITKIDSITKEPLAEAEFSITEENGKLIGTYITDKSGIITTPELESGKYTITEIKAPNGYKILSKPQIITVSTGEPTKIIVENTPSSSLEILKTDEITNKCLSGAVFTVISLSGNIIGDFTTDDNGLIKIDNLSPNQYLIKEIKAPDGYAIKSESSFVKVEQGKLAKITITNKALTGISIKKVDSNTKEPLSGAKFEIYKQNETTPIFTGITDNSGILTTGPFDSGYYIVKEIQTPDGYLLDKEPKTIEIKAGQPYTLTVENKPLAGLKIKKVDKDTKEPLSKAVFNIEKSDGTNIGDYTTNDDGTVLITNLDTDFSYKIKEIQAPDGYIISLEEQTVNVNYGIIKEIVFTNQKNSGIIIKKKDSMTGMPLSNALFTVEDSNGIVVYDGITDSTGTLLTGELKPGIYKVTETKAPSGYQLDSKPKIITVELGQTKTVEFTNSPLTSLLVEKVDSITSEALSGARFKIMNSDGDTIQECVTGNDGLALVSDLKPGKYIVKEIEAPKGYLMDSPSQIADVKMGSVAHLTFLDTPIVGITIHSIDKNTKKPIAGTIFEVYIQNGTLVGSYTTDNTGTVQTDKLEPGFYVIKQIKAENNYTAIQNEMTVEVKAGNKPVTVTFESIGTGTIKIQNINSINEEFIKGSEFEITKINGEIIGKYITDKDGISLITGLLDGYYVIKQTLSGKNYILSDKTYNIEVKAGEVSEIVIRNEPMTGLKINILDFDTKEPLAGAMFVINEQNGKVVGEFTSDSTGVINTNIYKPGKYVIEQIKAPDGYMLYTNQQLVDITNSEPTIVTFLNKSVSNIIIKYNDSISMKGINGAVFEISEQNGKTIGSYTTENDGTITTNPLEAGYYIITLKSAPDGYIFIPISKTIQVTTGRPSIVEFTADSQNGLQLELVDTKNNHITGGVFEVSKISGEIVGKYTTEADGCVTITNLNPGYYKVKQISTINGYQISENEETIEITSKNPGYIKFINRVNTGTVIKIIDSSDKPVNNVKVEIKHQNGNIIGVYTADNTGIINVSALKPGFYIISIISIPDGYEITEKSKTIEITSEEPIQITFKLESSNTIQIKLTDSALDAPIAGGSFKITAVDGTVIGTYTTDNTGFAVSKNVIPGWYIVEQITPPNGYQLSSESKKNIEVTNKNAAIISFTNFSLSSVQIKNLDKETEVPIKGAAFNITTIDGSFICETVIDHNGTALLNDIKPGWYLLTQTKAPYGYSINNTPIKFEVVLGKFKDIIFYNESVSGLTIMAVDSKGIGLEGMIVRLEKQNGEFIGEYTTDKSGYIHVPKCEPGYYIITEIKEPEGYFSNLKSKTIEIKSGSSASVTFSHNQQAGIQIRTSSKQTGDTIENAVYEIEKLNGEKIGTYTSDEQGLIYVNLLPEYYSIKQISVPNGFALAPEAKTIQVTTDKTVIADFIISQLSSIRIHITDSNTGNGIYNMRFLLKSEDNKIIGEYITNDQGYAEITNKIENGTYKLEQISSPEGYPVDNVPHTIKILNGETTEVIWETAKASGQIQVIVKSSDYNFMTDLEEGSLLQGAVFEISNPDNFAVVDTITTDTNGVAASKPLPIGRYIIIQKTASNYYSINKQPLETKLKIANDIVRIEVSNNSLDIGLNIKHQSNNAVNVGTSMRYDYTAVNNESDIRLDDFYWNIKVPTDGQRAGTIYTGTWNKRVWYSISYKTNMADFHTLEAKLLSTNQYQFDLSSTALNLQSGEYVTDIRFIFDTVPANFTLASQPAVYMYVLPNLINGYKLVNRSDIGGKYNNEWQTATSTWTTTIMTVSGTLPSSLPKTGY